MSRYDIPQTIRVSEWQARAEKAERERDEWKEAHDHHEQEVAKVCIERDEALARIAQLEAALDADSR